MQHYQLRKDTDNSIIFEGYYNSMNTCLEDAVNRNVVLSHVNLKNQNLTNANLDGCIMSHANFCGANLTGANLSEADLNHALFYNCGLYNTCLSYSDLSHSDFRDAFFGATLIDGSNLQQCLFSTLSSLDLNFQYVANMAGCAYTDPDGQQHNMSTPPIVIKGLLSVPIIVLDDLIKIGSKTISKTNLPQLSQILGFYTQKIAA